jgi:hypothetical protein
VKIAVVVAVLSALLCSTAGCGGDDDGGGGGADGGGGGDAAGAIDGGTPVEFELHVQRGGAAANANWFAIQDGDRPWQMVEGLGGTYTLTRTSARFGLAWVCTSRSTYHFVSVMYLTADDSLPETIWCEQNAYAEVSGEAGGLEPGQEFRTRYRGGGGQGSADDPVYDGLNVPAKDQDIVALRVDDTNEVIDLLIQRDRDVDGSPMSTFNFAGDTILVEEVAPKAAGVYSSSIVIGGTLASLSGSDDVLRRIDEASLTDEDIIEYRARGDGGFHEVFTHDGAAPDFDPPADPVTGEIALSAGGADAQFRAAFDEAPDELTVLRIDATQLDGESSVFWRVLASEAWLDGQTVFETPGLGEVADWNADWSLEEGFEVSSYAWAEWSSSGTATQFPQHIGERHGIDDDGLERRIYTGFNATIIP